MDAAEKALLLEVCSELESLAAPVLDGVRRLFESDGLKSMSFAAADLYAGIYHRLIEKEVPAEHAITLLSNLAANAASSIKAAKK
jgi:hypothetical protein